MRRIAPFLLICTLVGCGDDSRKSQDREPDPRVEDPANDAGMEPGADLGADDASETAADANTDAGPSNDAATSPDGSTDPGVVTCDPSESSDTAFTLDEMGLGGQLYARAAWDGRGVWVVYNGPKQDGGPEAMFVARVACDGTVDVGPREITGDVPGQRNYMPAIDSRGGVTHIAWIAQPEGENAKRVEYQAFGRDGEALFASPRDVTPTGSVEAVSDLIWELDIAALNEGAAVVASAGNFGEFQVVVQKFSSDAELSGPAFFPAAQKDTNQTRPSIASDAQGNLYVSWTRSREADPENGVSEMPETVVFTSIPAGAMEAYPAEPLVAKPLTNPNPLGRLSKTAGPADVRLLAFQVTSQSRSDILVRDAADFESSTTLTLGSDGWNNFRPSVAGGPDRGVLAWYRYRQSPLRAELVVQDFVPAGAGEGFTANAERPIPLEQYGISPYGPAITHVQDNLYFVAWSEGSAGADAKVRGLFLTF